MTVYVFPAVHWQHLRTAHPIESTFATIRHRTTRTIRMKGCVTRDSMLHMMFKLGECLTCWSENKHIFTGNTSEGMMFTH